MLDTSPDDAAVDNGQDVAHSKKETEKKVDSSLAHSNDLIYSVCQVLM